MPFLKRLQELIDSRAGGNNSGFAKFCGIKESNIRSWQKGSLPNIEIAGRIAKACSVSLDWLCGDQDEPEPGSSDVVQVERISLVASAGSGAMVLSKKAGYEPVSRLWLRQLGIPERRARILHASGDSMKPTISDGDPLLIDTSSSTFVDGWVCVFTVGDDAFVKRLRRGPGHTIMVSDNPEWPTREELIPPVEHFRLVGRVRWVGRTL